jgi:hypothetical protein
LLSGIHNLSDRQAVSCRSKLCERSGTTDQRIGPGTGSGRWLPVHGNGTPDAGSTKASITAVAGKQVTCQAIASFGSTTSEIRVVNSSVEYGLQRVAKSV